jgi:hypothetical protein
MRELLSEEVTRGDAQVVEEALDYIADEVSNLKVRQVPVVFL